MSAPSKRGLENDGQEDGSPPSKIPPLPPERPPSPSSDCEWLRPSSPMVFEPMDHAKSSCTGQSHRASSPPPQEFVPEFDPPCFEMSIDEEIYNANRPDSPCSYDGENEDIIGTSYDLAVPDVLDDEYEDLFQDDVPLPLDAVCSEKDLPVYKDAPITLHQSLVSILTFAMKFSLSGRCIQALLSLINLHCPAEENIFKKSLYLFKKYFSHVRGAKDYRYFCSKCLEEVPSKSCKKCEGLPPLCYLVTLDTIDQLRKMFKRKGFCAKLQHPQQREENVSDISDIYSGKLFQELKGNKNHSDYDLSFQWYTDGAVVYESGKQSAWLLLLTINNLQYKERYQKENLVVPGIWVGPVKPHGNLLLESSFPALQQLHSGVPMDVEDIGTRNITGSVDNGTADGPARALMLNMVAHNGERSCQKCYQPGECREGCVGVRVFPYRPDEMEPRTEEKFEEEGKLAGRLKTVNAYMGIKGPTMLSKISSRPVQGTGIDVMHLVYGGTSKLITKLLLDKSYTKRSFNISNTHQALISEQLLKIRVPAYLTRVPQSLSNMADWKTSLWKSWFLYFALPLLKDRVSDVYFKHFASLVAAVQLLNADCVSQQSLDAARQLINKFVSFFEDMYGRDLMTLNVHLLLHLIDLVVDLGPLWVSACFPQESINGVVMKQVHGSRYAEMQIASSINMCLGLPDIVSSLEECPAKELCHSMMKTTSRCKSTVIRDVTVVGDIRESEKISSSLPVDIFKTSDLAEKQLLFFHSVRKEGCLYVAESYTRTKERDSSCASYWNEGELQVGLLKTFVKAECSCDGSCVCELYVVVQPLEVIESLPTLIPSITVPNIQLYRKLDEFCVVSTNALFDVCIKMDIDDNLYVAKRCNRKEVE